MPAPRVAILLALLGLPVVCRAGPEAPHLTPETLADVLYVRAGDSTGTAFLLRYGEGLYLVTARHVVVNHLEDPTVSLRFHVGGKRGRALREVRLLGESERADVAVYTFDEDPNVPYFAPDAGLVPLDEMNLASPVFLVGYPASLRQTYDASQLRVVGGWVAGLKEYVPGSTVEYVDLDMAGVEHGHSGGPILVLPDRVAAVAVQRRTGSVTDTIGATYAVPIKYVTALIDGRPVQEDHEALMEALRGTRLVCGIAEHTKGDYDVWAQRIQSETGEGIWGDLGHFVAASPSGERAFQVVPSNDGASLVIHAAVYSSGDDHDILVQKLSPAGELLFDGGVQSRPVAVTPRPERRAVAVTDGADGAIVVYERHREDGGVDVRAQRISPEGALLWASAGVPVGLPDRVEQNPIVLEDGGGGALVLFEVRHVSGDLDLVAQHLEADGSLSWHEGKRPAVVAASDLPEFRARAVSDDEGGALVVYERELKDGRRVLLAQRLSRHGALLWNEGLDGVPVTGLRMAGGRDGVAMLADGSGGAFVAFEVAPNPQAPEDVDLAMQRLDADGEMLWGRAKPVEGVAASVLVAASRFDDRRPVLLADGQGGVVVALEVGSEQGDTDLMAQRVDGDGHLRWNGGERAAELSATFLEERVPRFIERHGDRVAIMFEVERPNGRRLVACQALSVRTGKTLYGGGRLPVTVVDSSDLGIDFSLRIAEEDD